MKKRKQPELDFEVDDLTNSIRNIISGDSFPTGITLITKADLKAVAGKNYWQFDWSWKFRQPARDVYKLTIVNNQPLFRGWSA